MDLLVIRHAIAEDPAADRPDAARALTRRGRRRFKAAVAGLGALGVRFDRLLTSPLTRAVQTSELLEPLLDGEAQITDALAAPPDAALLGMLAALPEPTVALVGHEPWLGELAALLLTGKTGPGGNLAFRKGGVAWLEGQPAPGQMSLKAWLPPRVLRGLARQR